MLPAPEKLISLQELAEFLNVSDRTIYSLIANNEIPFIRIGKDGDYRFDKQIVIDTLANSNTK